MRLEEKQQHGIAAGKKWPSSCMVVERKTTSLVKPARASPERKLSLSASDILCRRIPYTRRVLFYRLQQQKQTQEERKERGGETNDGGDDSDDDDDGSGSSPSSLAYEAFVSRLKSSLSLALAHFYPFAGRLRYEEEDADDPAGARRRLHVDCNDMGAELVEVHARLVGHAGGFEELQLSNFEMRQPLFDQLVPWAHFSPEHHLLVAPLLSIQVTCFNHGSGIAIGLAHSHIIADGNSMWHFMTSWAQCARGETISLLPTHTRALLKVHAPSTEKAMFKIEKIDECSDGKHIAKHPSRIEKVFSFTKDMVGLLKNMVDGKFSSYELVCAHIWKCTTKARGTLSSKKVGFISVVNMRSRMEPVLPKGFFGNALMWTIATCKVGELLSEDLSMTAMRIRTSISCCTNSTYWDFLHWLEASQENEDTFFSTCTLNTARMRVSSSPKFPTFGVDFGWGKPLATRCATILEAGNVAFFPSNEGIGSVDACIALPKHTMEQFELENSLVFREATYQHLANPNTRYIHHFKGIKSSTKNMVQAHKLALTAP